MTVHFRKDTKKNTEIEIVLFLISDKIEPWLGANDEYPEVKLKKCPFIVFNVKLVYYNLWNGMLFV